MNSRLPCTSTFMWSIRPSTPGSGIDYTSFKGRRPFWAWAATEQHSPITKIPAKTCFIIFLLPSSATLRPTACSISKANVLFGLIPSDSRFVVHDEPRWSISFSSALVAPQSFHRRYFARRFAVCFRSHGLQAGAESCGRSPRRGSGPCRDTRREWCKASASG